MISVKNAQQLIIDHRLPMPEKTIPTLQSAGYFLATDVYAIADYPSFNQSAVDGYAITAEYIRAGEYYPVDEEIPAGKTVEAITTRKPGAVFRIFTGAIVPPGADTVIMQEHTQIDEHNRVAFEQANIVAGKNIRLQGYAVKKGDLLFRKGEQINEATVGVLVSQGIKEVRVFDKPKIVCIVTGSELKPLSAELQPGEIYESNSYVLQAVLRNEGFEQVDTIHVTDNADDTYQTLKNVLSRYDVIIFSGGISVGNYDFVSSAAAKNNVQTVFYKVKQKPGKPLFFGETEKNAVFGLPGNPAAALNAMYLYVIPFLKNCIGANECFYPVIETRSAHSFKSKAGRTRFLKALTDFNTTRILDGQNSDQLLSFAQANCLVEIPDNIEYINENEPLKTHLIHLKTQP